MLKTVNSAVLQPIAQSALSAPSSAPDQPAVRPLWELFQGGQLLELSGRKPGKLSTVARLIARAQAQGEPAAWLTVREGSCFYPPDFVAAGVDLAALVVVRLGESAGSHGVLRAAEVLLRSGAFGLAVIDLVDGIPKGELSWQARLSGLLRRHDARAVIITGSQGHEPSLGPLVALRVEPCTQAGVGGRALLTHQLLKCKVGSSLGVSPDARSLPVGA